MQVRKASSVKSQLLITPTMLENARGNKCTAWLYLQPWKFLTLTIEPGFTVQEWIGRELPETKTVEEYNAFARSGKSILMPWLDVDMHTGKVIGHEGRHRAAACELAGQRKFPVAICLRERGYPIYYRHDDDLKKTFLTHEDIPEDFRGQFNNSRVLVDHRLYEHDFWAAWNR